MNSVPQAPIGHLRQARSLSEGSGHVSCFFFNLLEDAAGGRRRVTVPSATSNLTILGDKATTTTSRPHGIVPYPRLTRNSVLSG